MLYFVNPILLKSNEQNTANHCAIKLNNPWREMPFIDLLRYCYDIKAAEGVCVCVCMSTDEMHRTAK